MHDDRDELPAQNRKIVIRIARVGRSKSDPRTYAKDSTQFVITSFVKTEGVSEMVNVGSVSMTGTPAKALKTAQDIGKELEEELFIFGYDIMEAN
jgi:hypothetical protein